jgi:sigma-E factor negative regulatory protein RseC
MEETGVVVERDGGMAKVRIERSESCEGCHGCLMSDSAKYMLAEVENKAGASLGDEVRISTAGATPLKATLLLFGLPLVLLFAGYAAGSALAGILGRAASAEGFGIAAGALFFAGSFGLIALINKAVSGKKAERSAIVEILGHREQTV